MKRRHEHLLEPEVPYEEEDELKFEEEEKRAMVLIDLGHDELFATGIGRMPGIIAGVVAGGRPFVNWLIHHRDYEVALTEHRLSRSLLSDWDILLIINPSGDKEFFPEEVDAILEWVKGGGCLLFARPIGKNMLESFTRKIGLIFTRRKLSQPYFFADINDRIMKQDPEAYGKIKELLNEHFINKGVPVVAEGPYKSKLYPYAIEVDDNWKVIGVGIGERGNPEVVAAVREFGNGAIVALGMMYIFYTWNFWLRNEKYERDPRATLRTVTFFNRIFDYFDIIVERKKAKQRE
ncbi:MAG: hypothetical protein ACTSXJ_06155 [Candidatus Baldrarchaeia archaeon]